MSHCFTNDEDIANVRDMREALGNDIGIMIDVNQGWSVDESIKVGLAIEKYNPEWLEEPVMAANIDFDKICDLIFSSEIT